jgi:sec-independent protein translocase protein TatA
MATAVSSHPSDRDAIKEEESMPSLGWQELMIVLVIVIIIFGAGKLPEIGGAMGKSIKEFKKATDDDTNPSLPKDATTASASTAGAPQANRVVQQSNEVRADDI